MHPPQPRQVRPRRSGRPRRSLGRSIASIAIVSFGALALVACGDDGAGDADTADTTGTTGTAGTAGTATDATDPTDATSATEATDAAAVTTASTATSDGGTASDGSTVDTAGGTGAEVAISEERCARNEAAGTITYISGFDYAAAASIVDVVVAEEKGYFDALCLDVQLQAGFSTSNFPLVAAGTAQFSSAGSYTEILNYSVDGAAFTALVNYGKTPIEALVVKDPAITELSQLEGATIGVKGDIPPSLVAMLSSAGLTRGTDYEEILVDGFDPLAHLELDIDALPVYKSNEPGQLDAAGVAYGMFDPAELGIPGSFGIIYTSAEYAAENPEVVRDFVRAALKGMEDALADPEGAVAIALEQIDAAGNEFFLTQQGETYRWTQELAEVLRGNPDGKVGAIDAALLEAQVDAYTEIGVFAEAPSTEGTYDPDMAAGLYAEDGTVIWPGEG